MLYLIEDRDYLKIGYTKDIDSRWKNYQLHNCYAKLISTKEGSRMDEINHFKQIVTFRFINIVSCYTIEPNISDKMLEKIKHFVNNGDKF